MAESEHEVETLSGDPFPEVERLTTLEHPHVANVLEIGQKDGRPFVEKEVVHGRAIDRVVKVGRVELTELLALTLPMVEGVAAAHEHGVPHRDLRPANVIIDARGRAKIVGFRLCPADEDPALTPHYRAPEQLQGEEGDLRSDVFSLGVILFELAAGVRPFDGPDLGQVARAVRERKPFTPAQIDPQLSREYSRIVMRALEKDPGKRYASVVELREDLVRLRDNAGSEALPDLRPPRRLLRDGQRLVALGIGLLLVLVVLWALFVTLP